MGSLQTVHVAGLTAAGGAPTTLDVHLVNGQGGRGRVSQSGLTFNVIAVGQSVYLNAPSSVWQHFGGAAAAQLIDGRWLKVPASGQFAAFAQLTDLRALFSTLFSNRGTLAKGSTTTINGQKAIAVNDTTRGGTIYVATTGKPYTLQVAKSGSSGGRINFDQFNQSVSVNAPGNALDVSQLPRGGGERIVTLDGDDRRMVADESENRHAGVARLTPVADGSLWPEVQRLLLTTASGGNSSSA